MKNVEKLTPFKKFCMTIGNIPNSYVESRTYLDLLNWFCDFLQNTVIPSVNNNSDCVTELQNLFDDLQNFVNHYFDNLDVQAEINNKLDEMSENGELYALIEPYILPFQHSVNNQLHEMNVKIDAVASGSPLVASDVSQMSDTSKTYVNTSDGHWYYFDGSSWQNGGVYQSTAISNDDPVIFNLSNRVDALKNFTLEWLRGTISNDGTITTGDRNNFYSQIIPNSLLQGLPISIPSNRYLIVAYYNKQGIFISRSSAMQASTFTIDPNSTYNVRLVIATETSGNNLDLNTVLLGFDFSTLDLSLVTLNNEIENFNLVNIASLNKIEFLNNFICSDSDNKIIHFSVDDTWLCLRDITNINYSSIFENSFFNALKRLHDTYGICVTLNTFNTNTTDSSYSISNLPNRYQSEFQSIKSWLKFAFHGENENSNYNSSTNISHSYDTFINAIYNLTGDYECIDSFTRLGFFGGTLQNVLTLKNKLHGITGLLAADDNRSSYYLNSSQNNIIMKKGKFIDLQNELIFLKTITRNLNQVNNVLANNLPYQKFVEIFMHEYEFSTTPIAFNGFDWNIIDDYVNAFPSLLLS